MKTEILNIASPFNAEAVEQASASLKAMPGVQDVLFIHPPLSLHARLGDAAPTRAELVAVLAKAGVTLEEERHPHAHGNCCGGCGS